MIPSEQGGQGWDMLQNVGVSQRINRKQQHPNGTEGWTAGT